jgi:hypothetical protein
MDFARERDERHFLISNVSMSYELSPAGLSHINMLRLASNKRIRDFILYNVQKPEPVPGHSNSRQKNYPTVVNKNKTLRINPLL